SCSWFWAYKSLYNYQCHTLMDLKLSRGDILEVIEETQHWLYVKKHTVKDKNGIVKEEGYVPRNYVKPVTSLEANLWYFENIKTRIEAKRCLLRPENSEGAFLVWRSSKNHHFYLSVKNEPHARHYRIKEQETDQRFYLVIQKTFKTLSELVQSYSKHQDGLFLTVIGLQLDVPTLPSLSVDAQWEVDRSLLTKVKKLGSGEFAEVWQGVWDKKIDVAIKELRGNKKITYIHTEIKIMKELHHERLLKLYAVCTISEPFCIITELMKNGSLKKYLISKCSDPISKIVCFTSLPCFCMAYLESKNIVHRDLRADNILLTDMQSCKIADFGLAQFTFQMDQNISSVPVKWMAPEIFDGREYTTKCDVWSFGVLLTEIITYGNNPYPGKVIQNRRGERMKRPLDCPLALYDIMLLCWIFNPQERPCFTELQDRLMENLQ
uniref:Tyrosine-protein kinase n=1 Tax=Electrophorus electricus TaxID=8005 RepID=A0A4W4F8M3_ELEEL